MQALLTGASSGIGAALAPRLAAAGYDLVLVARRRERLDALADELRAAHGREVTVLAVDLAADGAYRRVAEAAPAPDVLVNNAGVGTFGSILRSDAGTQALMVRLNCEALTGLTAACLPGMVERGSGVVVNVSSVAGFQPLPFYATYGASKAYVIALSEALDEELAGTGVRVVAVCPGPVPTEFQGKAGSPDASHASSWVRRSPEQVAEACLAAIARPQRVVVPAAAHRFMWWAQRMLPRRAVTALAARGMRKRGL